MKKKAFSLLFVFVLIAIGARAQEYKTGLGIRLGGISQGITLKHFVKEDAALEGIFSFGRRSLLITGLYEKHKPLGASEGLRWFYGGGLHLGFYNDGYDYFYYKSRGTHLYISERRRNKVGVGADFIIGMEYKITNAPITLGLDLKPFVDFTEDIYFYWDGAFSARFTF